MQDIKIYNSLTRQKELFKPLDKNHVKFYVCGLTVYDNCHVGHARLYVCVDVMIRIFRALGYEVLHVRNITDIDDKIINKALEQDKSVHEITSFYIQAIEQDFDALDITRPDIEPKATDHVNDMIDLIQTLIEKGYAYQGSKGDVYFRTDRFDDYGRLSCKDLKGQMAGIRVMEAEDKESSQDFVLWKQSKPNEPAWSSPWGSGRPGWHIECSAMSMRYLGATFDLHGGGCDLLFPHHENELAQSEAATGEKFVNCWLHVGYLQINDAKMSKSLHNFVTVKDVLEHYDAEVLRYFLLSSHYRSQLNYSEQALKQAQLALARLYGALKIAPEAHDSHKSADMDESLISYHERFYDAMADDFNTPVALAVLFELASVIYKNSVKGGDVGDAASLLISLGHALGILQNDPEHFFQAGVSIDPAEIEALITSRNQARSNKDWAMADQIRDRLKQQGIELEDTSQGTLWRVGEP